MTSVITGLRKLQYQKTGEIAYFDDRNSQVSVEHEVREFKSTLTADTIIEYNDAKIGDCILLVLREYWPYGIGTPGGRHDIGKKKRFETLEQAALRENIEETKGNKEDAQKANWVTLYNPKQPFRVLSDPDRDPRKWWGQVITNVYIGIAEGKAQAGDDAKDLIKVKPEHIRKVVGGDFNPKYLGGVILNDEQDRRIAFKDHGTTLLAYMDRRDYLEKQFIAYHKTINGRFNPSKYIREFGIPKYSFYSDLERKVYEKRLWSRLAND